MPRIRADDYDDKRVAIINAAADLFSERGYSSCRMEQIADRCSATKSMLYHYFSKKEDILFEILQQHVLQLMERIKTYASTHQCDDPLDFFRGFIAAYLEPSGNIRSHHVVALYNMRYLTADQQAKQVKLERDFLKLVQEILAPLSPANNGNEKAYSLLLLGMMNWVELWYHRSGKISPGELYDRTAQLFLFGYQTPYEPDAKERASGQPRAAHTRLARTPSPPRRSKP